MAFGGAIAGPLIGGGMSAKSSKGQQQAQTASAQQLMQAQGQLQQQLQSNQFGFTSQLANQQFGHESQLMGQQFGQQQQLLGQQDAAQVNLAQMAFGQEDYIQNKELSFLQPMMDANVAMEQTRLGEVQQLIPKFMQSVDKTQQMIPALQNYITTTMPAVGNYYQQRAELGSPYYAQIQAATAGQVAQSEQQQQQMLQQEISQQGMGSAPTGMAAAAMADLARGTEQTQSESFLQNLINNQNSQMQGIQGLQSVAGMEMQGLQGVVQAQGDIANLYNPSGVYGSGAYPTLRPTQQSIPNVPQASSQLGQSGLGSAGLGQISPSMGIPGGSPKSSLGQGAAGAISGGMGAHSNKSSGGNLGTIGAQDIGNMTPDVNFGF